MVVEGVWGKGAQLSSEVKPSQLYTPSKKLIYPATYFGGNSIFHLSQFLPVCIYLREGYYKESLDQLMMVMDGN